MERASFQQRGGNADAQRVGYARLGVLAERSEVDDDRLLVVGSLCRRVNQCVELAQLSDGPDVRKRAEVVMRVHFVQWRCGSELCWEDRNAAGGGGDAAGVGGGGAVIIRTVV